MIRLTRINGSAIMLNDDLIQTMEETPDTVITLTNGAKYVVKESCENIRQLIIEYKRNIFSLYIKNM